MGNDIESINPEVRLEVINMTKNLDKRLENLYHLIENDILSKLMFSPNDISYYKVSFSGPPPLSFNHINLAAANDTYSARSFISRIDTTLKVSCLGLIRAPYVLLIKEQPKLTG